MITTKPFQGLKQENSKLTSSGVVAMITTKPFQGLKLVLNVFLKFIESAMITTKPFQGLKPIAEAANRIEFLGDDHYQTLSGIETFILEIVP